MIPREPEEDKTSESKIETVETEDLEVLKQVLGEEKEKAEGYLANWQRSQADFVNYKRRNEQEKKEISKYANTSLILSLLSSLDDLERAFASISPHIAEDSWVDGVRLIERKLHSTMEAQGLSPIEALGEPFDPNFHEAVMHGKGEDGLVVGELQKGYKLYDRVIRPTGVVVGNGEEKEEE